jgi:hypothetical protein
MTLAELAKLESLALDAVQENADWYEHTRDCDYVAFGPIDNWKDNGEGPRAAYALIAALDPATVLGLIRQAKRRSR